MTTAKGGTMSLLALPDEILSYILVEYLMRPVDHETPVWYAVHDPLCHGWALQWLRETMHLRLVCKRLLAVYDDLPPFATFVAVAEGRLHNAHTSYPRYKMDILANPGGEAWSERYITCPEERRLVDKMPTVTASKVDRHLMRRGACPANHWEYGLPIAYHPKYSAAQIVIRHLLSSAYENKRQWAKQEDRVARIQMTSGQKYPFSMQRRLARERADAAAAKLAMCDALCAKVKLELDPGVEKMSL